MVATGGAKQICKAVKACGKDLASDDVGIDRGAYGEVLLLLLDHPMGEVRQALAEIGDTLSDAHFDLVIERLADDSDRYVRNAATATAARKVSKRKARGKAVQQEEQVLEALDEIAAKDGKAARRRVDAAVRRGVEQFVRRLEHELNKPDSFATRALVALQAELAKPDASVALMRRHVATLDEQVDFRRTIMERARQYATEIKAVFVAQPIVRRDRRGAARRQLVARVGARAARLAFEVDIDPELEAEVDKYALLQALQNVLQNAVEAYPKERDTLPVRIANATAVIFIGVFLDEVREQPASMSTRGIPYLSCPIRMGDLNSQRST